MRTSSASAAVLAGLLSTSMVAAQTPARPPVHDDEAVEGTNDRVVTARIKPVVIDGSSSHGATLGLDYHLQAKLAFRMFERTLEPGEAITLDDVSASNRHGQIDLLARGTIANHRDQVPNKLIDFSGKGVYKFDTDAFYARLGVLGAFETDQAFENRQHLFGITGSITRVGVIPKVAGDAGTVILNVASVKPTSDPERERLLGNLESFPRVSAEVSYTFPTPRNKYLRSIDLDYRHYQEIGAPEAIKAAGLDRYRLGLVRANLNNDFFVQFSRGSLPFDLRSERAVKVGWSLKLE